ncbi:hypothetical protein A3F86_02285 [candidate division WOR-1 bacterium RIFCSPLOWO2_12_FULL_45_9]|uniref:Cobalamin biosynthesis protein CbiM n=1 Tax=candidate division WOR-1 bacterium RIFCSPLOWO2_12_FULL_45_9 TaxID=1802568 RepID=A0A1F4RND4_UNCSA|nr:MAG: hypothetical protein A3F86_02285 [candidate division WOR-1 bacterium RIFCSPLOWO2_12_FULL_45_9]
MHIPDGFLDPKVSYGLMGMAVAVLSFCLNKVKAAVTALAPQEAFAVVGNGIKCLAGSSRRVFTGKLYLMGMVTAVIFAIQSFDFIVIEGSSGHLMGGALAAIVLGPFAGELVMSAVLIVQALFLADGGLIALGANIINMAFLGTFVTYYIYAELKKYTFEWLGVALAAWLSLVIVALMVSLELGLGFGPMLQVHVVVGVAEALFTTVLVKLFRGMLPNE